MRHFTFRIIFCAFMLFLFLEEGGAEMIFRCTIACVDSSLEQTVLCFTNGRGHYDGAGNFYEPRLMTSFNMERHIFSDGATAGGSETALGTMEIGNLDGALDQYKDHGFDGRSVVLEAAPAEDGVFRTIWAGQASFAQFEWERVMIYLRDRQEQLYSRKVQEALYTGEDPEVEGKPIPQAYGRCLNVPLTLIDASLLLYQAAETLVEVAAVYDAGVALGQNQLKNSQLGNALYWDISNSKYVSIENGLMTIEAKDEQYSSQVNVGLEPSVKYRLSCHVEYSPGDSAISVLQFRYNTKYGILIRSIARENAELEVEFTTISSPLADVFYILGLNGTIIPPLETYTISNLSITPVAVDHPDRASLEAAVVPRGGYHTCLAQGLIRLGSTPNGEVTADVRGTSGAAVPAVVKALLLAKAGLAEADLDLPAFSGLESANDSEAGIYLTGGETFQDALDLLFGSVGAWYGFDRAQNKLTCARVEIPEDAALSLNIETETLASGGVSRLRTRDQGQGVPAWRVKLKHTRNWTVQGGGLVTDATYVANDLAGAVSEARRNWLDKEYREVVAENPEICLKHPLSPEMEFETLLLENAVAEAARRLALYSGSRERYGLTAPMELLFDPAAGMKLDLGGAVNITSDRFGMASGKTFLVIGMTEVYANGVDEVSLDLFG